MLRLHEGLQPYNRPADGEGCQARHRCDGPHWRRIAPPSGSSPVAVGARAGRRRLHRRGLRDRSVAGAGSALGEPDRQPVRRVRGHERRVIRRLCGRERRDTRGDDAGDRPAGAEPVPRCADQLVAEAQLLGVRHQRAAAAGAGRASGADPDSGLRSDICRRLGDRPGGGAAVGAVLERGHRAVRPDDPVRPRPHRRLPAADERAVPGGHRPRHLRADRVRRRGLGRRSDLDRGQRLDARCRWSTSRSRSRTAS